MSFNEINQTIDNNKQIAQNTEAKKEQTSNNPKIKELEQKLSDVNSAVKNTKNAIDTIEKTIDRKLLDELKIYYEVIGDLKNQGVKINDVDRSDQSTFNVGGFGKDQNIEVDVLGSLSDKKVYNSGFGNAQKGVNRLTKNKNILKSWRGKEALLNKNINKIDSKIKEVDILKEKIKKLNTIKNDINNQIEELKANENAPKLFNDILKIYKSPKFQEKFREHLYLKRDEVNKLNSIFPKIYEASSSWSGYEILYTDSNQISVQILAEGYEQSTYEGKCVAIVKKGQEFYLTTSRDTRHSGDEYSLHREREGKYVHDYKERKLSSKEAIKILSDLGKMQHIVEQSQIAEKTRKEALEKKKQQEENEHRLDKELKKID